MSRTTVASTRTAAASPRPICLTETSGVSTKDRNTTTMIAAAAEITRAGDQDSWIEWRVYADCVNQDARLRV